MNVRFAGTTTPGVTAVLMLLLLWPVACTHHKAQIEADSAQTAAAIERLSESWIEAFELGDAEASAAFFTEDAIYAANNGELLRGREEIRDAMSRWASRRPEGVVGDIHATKLRLHAAGQVAYTFTRFTITATPPGRVVEGGYMMAVLRRQPDGAWLIESLVVNRIHDFTAIHSILTLAQAANPSIVCARTGRYNRAGSGRRDIWRLAKAPYNGCGEAYLQA